MNLFKLSTVGLALVLTGWAACGDSSNSNPDVGHIGSGGAGGTVSSGGATGAGGVVGSGGATETGGVTGSGGVTAVGGSTGMGGATGAVPDAGVDAPISGPDVPSDVPADADAGDSGSDGGEAGSVVLDICAGLTATQCHLAIINATVDPTVSALDPGANPPIPYPTCSAQ
jgi:hypothetical protein